MSTLDLTTLVESLRSLKIKARNDALTALESSLSKKLHLTAKQYTILFLAILHSLNIERGIYKQNPSAAVMTRASRASSVLKDVVQQSMLGFPSDRPKPKSYLAVASEISMVYFVDYDTAFEACSINLAKTLGALYGYQSVFDNLSQEAWIKAYKFCVHALQHELESTDTKHDTMLLLEPLLTIVHNLMGGAQHLNIIPLTKNEEYLHMHQVLSHTLAFRTNKENATTVLSFKILIKLIIQFSTEDATFVDSLVKLGLNAGLRLSSTPIEALMKQLIVFINLDQLHRVIYFRLSESTETDSSSLGDKEAAESLRYNLGMLIQSLFSRMQNLIYRMRDEDIQPHLSSSVTNCFNLPKLSLASNRIDLWLLATGISKLINTFYGSQATENDLRHSNIRLIDSEARSRYKRQKVKEHNLFLWSCSSPLQFYKLLIDDDDSKVRTAGLQLLNLHMSFRHDQRRDASEPETIVDVSLIPDSGTSKNFYAEEYQTDSTHSTITSLLATMAHSIFQAQDRFLSLLASRNLITLHENLSHFGDSTRVAHMQQLLKHLLNLVKDRDHSQAAALLFIEIVTSLTGRGLHALFDDSSRKQVVYILELSEICGPQKFDETSCEFWRSALHVVQVLNMKQAKSFGTHFLTWFKSKWLHAQDSEDKECMLLEINFGLISKLLLWLAGMKIDTFSLSRYSCDTSDPFTVMKVCEDLQDFICMAKHEYISGLERMLEVHPLNADTGSILEISAKLHELTLSVSSSHDVFQLVLWSLQLFIICEKISKPLPSISLSLRSDAEHLMLMTSALIETSEHAYLAITALLTSGALTATAIDVGFPFEIISVRLSPSVATFRLEHLITNPGESTKAGLNESHTIDVEDVAIHHSLKYLEYLVKFERESDSSILRKLDLLQSKEFMSFTNLLLKTDVFWGGRNATLLFHIVRKIGVRILSDATINTSKEALILTGSALRLAVSSLIYDMNENARLDCDDIIGFLICISKKAAVIDEQTLIEVLSAIASVLVKEKLAPNLRDEVFQTLMGAFEVQPNRTKSLIAENLRQVGLRSNLTDRRIFFENLSRQFDASGRSTESFATYSLIFIRIFGNVPLFLVRIAQVFMKHFAIPLLRKHSQIAMQKLMLQSQYEDTGEFFEDFRMEFINFWRCHDSNLSFSVFGLFGFFDEASFILDNYRQVLAVMTAIRGTETSRFREEEIIRQICALKKEATQTLLADCVNIVIPLSFTANGIRHKIFDILRDRMQQAFETILRDNIMLIVLEVLKNMDVSSQLELETAFGPSAISPMYWIDNDAEVFSTLSVSPKYCLELINLLTKSFRYLGAEEFWNATSIYFFIRHMGLTKMTMASSEYLAVARKIRLILSMGKSAYMSVHLLSLLMDVAANCEDETAFNYMLITLESATERMSDASVVDELHFSAMNLIAKLMNEPQFMSQHLSSLLHRLENIFEDRALPGSVDYIIKAAFRYLRDLPFSLAENELEAFILCNEYSTFSQHCRNGASTVIRELFQRAEAVIPFTKSLKLTKALLHDCEISNLGQKFGIWATTYLGDVFTDDKINFELPMILQKQEYSRPDAALRFESYKNLDEIIEMLCKDLYGGTYTQKLLVEGFLGFVLWSINNNNAIPGNSFITHDFTQRYASYIACLDYRSCILSQIDLSVPNLTQDSLQAFLRNFSSTRKQRSVIEWANQLLLAILVDLFDVSCLIPALTSLFLKLPHLSRKYLPPIVVFYVLHKKEESSINIPHLLKEFWRSFSEAPARDEINLMGEIIITIRAGKFRGVAEFEKLYDKLDKKMLYHVIRAGLFPKSAIMLFEDYVHASNGGIDWPKERVRLTKLYTALEEFDILSDLPDDLSLAESLTLMQLTFSPVKRLRYASALLDTAISFDGELNSGSVSNALADGGAHGLSKYVQEASLCKKSMEWCWKLGQWDTPGDATSFDKHSSIYEYFRASREKDVDRSQLLSDTLTRLAIFHDTNLGDSVPRHYSTSQKLEWMETVAIIQELDSIFISDPADYNKDMRCFKGKTASFSHRDVSNYEDLLQARRIAYDMSGELLRSNCSDLLLTEVSEKQDACWLASTNELTRLCDLLLEAGEPQKLANSVLFIEAYVTNRDFYGDVIKHEMIRLSRWVSAQALWAEGNTEFAINMLAELATEGDISIPFDSLYIHEATLRAHLVKWAAESRRDLATNILNQTVVPMESSIQPMLDETQKCKVYSMLASFCEEQYRSKSTRDHIDELKTRVRSRKAEIEEIKTHYGKTTVSSAEKKSVQKYYGHLKAQTAIEAEELKDLEETSKLFAFKATAFYLKSVLSSDIGDAKVDRFVSLFLELASDEDIQQELVLDLKLLPTHLILDWCMQLFSRLSMEDSTFQNSTKDLVVRMCQLHPFHTLYYLNSLILHDGLAKTNGNDDMKGRVTAAHQIQAWCRTSGPEYVTNVLMPVEKLARESIALAEFKAPKGRILHLDKLKIGLFWVEQLPQLPPPTLKIPKSAIGYLNHGYDDVPRMSSVDTDVRLAPSGLSLPKIAQVHLSNGRTHKFLLKFGTDDLRQDAIMEQVFDKMNKMLLDDKDTRSRRLQVRTYMAVPLGPKAGLIEFVPNSLALIDVIRPLHQGQDAMRAEKARELMKKSQAEDIQLRVKVYKQIEEKIKPVLRQYFLANFVTPDAWYNSRHVYLRGVAASSMVGHILGLGDRHCNNILLDKLTGEPIHIDLGVAFDQGKRLPIPETVPFRLTRDMVDGFGYMGTKGTFSRLCEHTLRVLRASEGQILAILDVLQRDPLYSWSILPVRKKRLQIEAASGIKPGLQQDGLEAGTAILTVRDKLKAKGLSVEATVRELIRESTSEQNLALIYCGWCLFF